MAASPNLPQSLINEPGQGTPASPADLGPLQHLLGTWTNQNIGSSGKGDSQSPFSYNVMPLPQVGGHYANGNAGFILKNFSYYEEITFSQIHGNAPNRGGAGTQVANTIFYEQRVYFAEGPDAGQLVHAENGSWLYLTDRTQLDGPYGLPPGGQATNILAGSKPPSQPYNLVKQMSVPHGNSILAGGNYTGSGPVNGAPTIPSVSVLPSGANPAPYSQQLNQPDNYQNPDIALTQNPNAALTAGLAAAPVQSYIPFSVNTSTSNVPVTNIPFEERVANVTGYSADYWLQSLDGTNFTQLQYSQNITMMMLVNGQQHLFPHVTTNTLTKTSDT